MNLLLAALMAAQAASAPARVANQMLTIEGLGTITYGIAVPSGGRETPRPLILALHPGGGGAPYYGSDFMRQIVLPALGDLQAVIVAPDCPSRSWTEPEADRAVMALVEKIRRDYSIDARHILVTGFSMGGRGTWFMSSHHPDLFTAAIPMAAAVGAEPLERLGLVPTYIIHSRKDQVVPFAPAEQNAHRLRELDRPVRFEALSEPGHYEMGAYIEPLRRAGGWIAERWRK